MSLQKYWDKRDFKITPEPRGEQVESKDTLAYYIQRHHARKLHYDFRLELNGTLKSWAIPKGPSFDPADKRLAVHVEDHPLSYGTFEGDIPPRQYGAGHVVLWDKGHWMPIGDPEVGYKDGNLKFMLNGHKLHGKWALVRMQKSNKEEGKDNWLLIKEKDSHAIPGPAGLITELRPESVMGMKDIVDERPSNIEIVNKLTAKPAHAVLGTIPESLLPQLATLAQQAPEGDEWLAEVKYDGYRALCRIDQGIVKLYTRAGNDWTSKWPSLIEALNEAPVDQAWLDGEVVAIRDDGSISFQALQNYHKHASSHADTKLAYYVFDMLYINGQDIRSLPLIDRKALLKEVISQLPVASSIYYSEHIVGSAATVFKDACKHHLEGIVVKQADAPYFNGRSSSWRKLKCVQQQEFVIGGYTDPEGGRQGFGALVLGIYNEQGQFVYAGRVGTGFDDHALSDISRKLKSLTQVNSGFDRPPTGQDLRGVHWLNPILVAQVRFAEWTDSGVIRHASFIALREDKAAKEIRNELLQIGTQSPETSNHTTIPQIVSNTEAPIIAGVKLTHTNKILFSTSQKTKLDLAQYYQGIESWIMPHLIDRPLSLLRCPDGSESNCFFQKHYNETSSFQIQQVEIPGNGHYMLANNLTAVIAMVQMGVLELHTWGSKKQHLMKPDRITIDLDPDPAVPWTKVVEGAQLVKFVLEEIGLVSFVKTTGGKGLHVVAPIKPELQFTEIKTFSKAIAEHLAKTVPDYFVAVMSKKKRVNKIYLDYLRNGAEATAIAAYSTRARPDGSISVPLDWKELNESVHADTFNLNNIMERLTGLKQDPWADYFTTKQRVTATMLKIFNAGSK